MVKISMVQGIILTEMLSLKLLADYSKTAKAVTDELKLQFQFNCTNNLSFKTGTVLL
jgi:hypothetical protein